jgi:transcription termination factor NusB
MGLYTMELDDSEKLSQKAEILYRLLCMNKQASMQYLEEAEEICKMEDQNERKKAFASLFSDLVNEIEQTKRAIHKKINHTLRSMLNKRLSHILMEKNLGNIIHTHYIYLSDRDSQIEIKKILMKL